MRNKKIIVALDAMGGDHAPHSVIEGAAKALDIHKKLYPQVALEYIIFGDKKITEALVDKFPDVRKISTINHSERKVEADEKPSYAMRNSKNTSMGMAINTVKQQQAHALVSSGNTGALMAIAKLSLRTLPGIDRPAIIGLLPTNHGKIVALDLGANAECESSNLVQFAIMGDAFAKALLNKEKPSIALLNIGSEDIKGNETIRNAAQILQDQDSINFTGYVEADDITLGVVDVVVADGFSGNVAIKMAEGTGRLCRTLMERAFKSSFLAKIGYLLAKKALKNTFKRIDGRYYNGAMLVGLNGVVVKSHGGADKVAFANAIGVAIELSINNINKQIINEISIIQQDFNRP
jgi:glycerol-3-phosphate acyltransferase PlsX